MAILTLLLCVFAIAHQALSLNSVCSSATYSSLLSLSTFSPAESYCSSVYPQPVVTTTVTRAIAKRAQATTTGATAAAATKPAATTAAAAATTPNTCTGNCATLASISSVGGTFASTFCMCIETPSTTTVYTTSTQGGPATTVSTANAAKATPPASSSSRTTTPSAKATPSSSTSSSTTSRAVTSTTNPVAVHTSSSTSTTVRTSTTSPVAKSSSTTSSSTSSTKASTSSSSTSTGSKTSSTTSKSSSTSSSSTTRSQTSTTLKTSSTTIKTSSTTSSSSTTPKTSSSTARLPTTTSSSSTGLKTSSTTIKTSSTSSSSSTGLKTSSTTRTSSKTSSTTTHTSSTSSPSTTSKTSSSIANKSSSTSQSKTTSSATTSTKTSTTTAKSSSTGPTTSVRTSSSSTTTSTRSGTTTTTKSSSSSTTPLRSSSSTTSTTKTSSSSTKSSTTRRTTRSRSSTTSSTASTTRISTSPGNKVQPSSSTSGFATTTSGPATSRSASSTTSASSSTSSTGSGSSTSTFPISVTTGGGSGKHKRSTYYLSFANSNSAVAVTDESQASYFYISNGDLMYNGEYVASDTSAGYVPFSLSTTPPTGTETWALDGAGDVSLSDGTFCMESNNNLFIVLTAVPSSFTCTPVSLAEAAPTDGAPTTPSSTTAPSSTTLATSISTTSFIPSSTTYTTSATAIPSSTTYITSTTSFTPTTSTSTTASVTSPFLCPTAESVGAYTSDNTFILYSEIFAGYGVQYLPPDGVLSQTSYSEKSSYQDCDAIQFCANKAVNDGANAYMIFYATDGGWVCQTTSDEPSTADFNAPESGVIQSYGFLLSSIECDDCTTVQPPTFPSTTPPPTFPTTTTPSSTSSQGPSTTLSSTITAAPSYCNADGTVVGYDYSTNAITYTEIYSGYGMEYLAGANMPWITLSDMDDCDAISTCAEKAALADMPDFTVNYRPSIPGWWCFPLNDSITSDSFSTSNPTIEDSYGYTGVVTLPAVYTCDFGSTQTYQASTACDCSWSFTCNSAVNGISGGSAQGLSPEDCANQCDASSKCAAFTWDSTTNLCALYYYPFTSSLTENASVAGFRDPNCDLSVCGGTSATPTTTPPPTDPTTTPPTTNPTSTSSTCATAFPTYDSSASCDEQYCAIGLANIIGEVAGMSVQDCASACLCEDGCVAIAWDSDWCYFSNGLSDEACIPDANGQAMFDMSCFGDGAPSSADNAAPTVTSFGAAQSTTPPPTNTDGGSPVTSTTSSSDASCSTTFPSYEGSSTCGIPNCGSTYNAIEVLSDLSLDDCAGTCNCLDGCDSFGWNAQNGCYLYNMPASSACDGEATFTFYDLSCFGSDSAPGNTGELTCDKSFPTWQNTATCDSVGCGNDGTGVLGGVIMGTDVDSCAETCNCYPECASFAWESNGYCILYNAPVATACNAGHSSSFTMYDLQCFGSGAPSCGLSFPATTADQTCGSQGAYAGGTDLITDGQTDQESCAQQCLCTDGCLSIAWDPNSQNCYLWSKPASEVNTASGPDFYWDMSCFSSGDTGYGD